MRVNREKNVRNFEKNLTFIAKSAIKNGCFNDKNEKEKAPQTAL